MSLEEFEAYCDALRTPGGIEATPEFARLTATPEYAGRKIAASIAAAALIVARTEAGRFPLQRFQDIPFESAASYLVKGFLPRTGLAVIWGEPKCGKSFWTSDLLLHVALGWEYRGRRVKSGPVVYCGLEGAQGFRARIEAFRQAKLAESADASPPFFLMSSPLSLVAAQAEFVAAVRAQLGDLTPVAVCIDTLNRSIAGSENDDEAMGAYVRAADAIRAAFDCLVVIVHHSGYSAQRPRGHSSLVGAVDIQISVKRDAAGNITVELELAKDGATGLQFVSRLKIVEIGRDEDGDPVTSCVIEPADADVATSKPSPGPRLPKAAQIALRALAKAIEEMSERAPASNQIPQTVRVVTVEQWRRYADQMGISETNTEDARRMAFKRAHQTLIAGNHVAAWGEYRWPAN